MEKHNDAMKTSGHWSLEKYTSHFFERVVCEMELETEQRLQHIDPHSDGHNSVSFPFSWSAQPGAWEPSFSGTWSSFQHLLLQLQLLNRGPEGPSAGYWFSLPHLISNWSEALNSNISIGVLRVPSAGCWFSLQHLMSNWLELPVHRVILLFYVHLIQSVDSQGYSLNTFHRVRLLFTQVLFTNPSARAGYDTRSIFKRSLTGLNSEFSFS